MMRGFSIILSVVVLVLLNLHGNFQGVVQEASSSLGLETGQSSLSLELEVLNQTETELLRKERKLHGAEKALNQTEQDLKHSRDQLEKEIGQRLRKENRLKAKEEKLAKKEQHLKLLEGALKKQAQAMQEDQNYVSACVMLMDGNHELVEWLAYHYHTLPLRRLIIWTDPASKTVPDPIAHRWRGLMNITIWKDEDIFPDNRIFQNEKNKANEYVSRQGIFHSKCMRTLYNEGRRWVQLFDPDEYVAINPRVYNQSDPMYRLGLSNSSTKVIPVPPPKEAGSTLRFIQDAIAHVHKYGVKDNTFLKPFETHCVAFNRRQFGTFQDTKGAHTKGDPDFPPAFQNKIAPSDLSTYRSRYWGGNKLIIGKALIDFSRINLNEIVNRVSVHRPIGDSDICAKEMAWVREANAPMVMNHYAGTKEQLLFRSEDSRGGTTRSGLGRYNEEMKPVWRTHHELHGPILDWLPGFVQSVGESEALRLLKHAGNPFWASAGAYRDPKKEVRPSLAAKRMKETIRRMEKGTPKTGP